MTNKPRAHDSGSIVAELLVWSVIIGIIAAIGGSMLGTTARLESGLRDHSAALIAELRATQLIAQAVRDADSHRFFPLKIHRAGRIRFADGRANPVMSHPGDRAPDRRADAITTARLDIRSIYRVERVRRHGRAEEFQICPTFTDEQHHHLEVRGFLGLTPDGLAEFRSEKPVTPPQKCGSLTLTRSASMSINDSAESGDPGLLIPIIDHYTLYVNQRGELRYLSHAGDRNIEDQPITEGLLRFRLSEASSSTKGSQTISLEIATLPDAPHDYLFRTHLSRIAPFTLLFNLWRGVE